MTDPYLNFFRRFLPPVGGGGFALDLSPIVGDHRALRRPGDRRRPDRRVSASARAWGLAGVLCALVVAADQAAKAVVEANLVPGEEVDVLGPLGLTLSHNRGVAFGLAGGAGAGWCSSRSPRWA